MNIINGDLLEVKKGLICHQVNCQRKMGKGLALAIRNKYPIVYKEYTGLEKMYLGLCQPVKINDDLYVANLFAQHNYGTGLKTNYDALTACLREAICLVKYHKLESINIPYNLGCGLAGGDWSIVSNIISKLESQFGIEFNIYKIV